MKLLVLLHLPITKGIATTMEGVAGNRYSLTVCFEVTAILGDVGALG